ncbi:MAG TPA: hypothetical protein VI172_04090 [Candidatus Dormibacteraeota bacterium]|jgi:hypothetical protein
MFRTLAALFAVLAVVACGSPAPTAKPSPAPTPAAARCADLVAAALASVVPVAGSFDCLAPAQQRAAAGLNITDDASLASFTALTGYEHARYIGPTSDAGYVYELDRGDGLVVVFVLWVNTDGLVYAIVSGTS